MNQRGYIVLLGLFALLGIGGVWLAGITVKTINHTANQTLALSQARTALISYAVNYIDHYGPQGAGIGHLPCPDTDAPSSTLAGAWHRDGPNPPCAKKPVEYGWLPRHVTVADGRYHFHTRTQQRLLYAVSGNFVNNPVGRIVNPSTSGVISVGQYTDVIAVVATPPLDVDQTESQFWLNLTNSANLGAAYTLIRTADIRTQSMQRVGAWLVGQLNNAVLKRCASVSETTDCKLSELSLTHCSIATQYVLVHWLNAQLSPANCADHELYLASTFALLEEVPIQRHWFMRNEWYKFVELSFDENCLNTSEVACRFALAPIVAELPSLDVPLLDVPLIKIRLQPIADVIKNEG